MYSEAFRAVASGKKYVIPAARGWNRLLNDITNIAGPKHDVLQEGTRQPRHNVLKN